MWCGSERTPGVVKPGGTASWMPAMACSGEKDLQQGRLAQHFCDRGCSLAGRTAGFTLVQQAIWHCSCCHLVSLSLSLTQHSVLQSQRQ